ncbi:MAG: DUF2961 domain-containing protein [Planctomycetes bacterium]|nr:DUF2961 domain-containing protein [Planctomycetota bacterium]
MSTLRCTPAAAAAGLIAAFTLSSALGSPAGAQAGPAARGAAAVESPEPPVIPIGPDAFLQWERWPYLRMGVRASMRSTFDRTGGNHFADAAHFIRQVDPERNVALDEVGPGILWFVRHNHWHGSPWRYVVDGRETVVEESSTRDPTRPVQGSVFLPERLFPRGLTWTWSETKGADLSWVPVPFERSLQLAYSRTRYGTGYFILWKLMPGIALSRPLAGWTESDEPPREVLELLARSGTDIAPAGEGVASERGELTLEPFAARTVLRLDGGPAVLRRLAFEVPEAAAPALAAARLRVWWDGRRVPSVDAPLGLFFGTASLLRGEGREHVVKSFPMTVRWQAGRFHFATYFPMPFLRSARIELSEAQGASIEGVRWEARHVPYRDPPNWVGLFHATHRDFPHPEPGRDLVLLDTREAEGGGVWCGHVVGTTYLFTRTANLSTLEGDPRFYLDDSLSPQGQGTGSEEWGGGGDYWGGRTMTLPFAGHPVGVPPKDAKTDLERVHSAYRFLLSDLLPFGRNARITLEHGGENLSREHYETVTYWYGIDRPGLILTDELDVGDLEDERLHGYRSPDASAPEVLSSRHELGPDHVPLGAGKGRAEVFPPMADDGRRTRTFSELTLKLDRRNLGVLLRRRLDLAYPNQRARVRVAAGGSGQGAEPGGGEPDWKDAGIWYTAGGNTVLFADPLGLPREELKVHPELAPPARIVETSNRRWREDELMIPRALTEGRDEIRVRLELLPVGLPLFPGRPPDEEAWTEYRYWAYCFVMPRG